MKTTFAFAIPTRNSVKTAWQTLVSLAGQSHTDWYAVVVDDCSTDGTADYVEECAAELRIGDKVRVVRNSERRWEVSNVLEAMSWMGDDDVVCRLDLDDYLCDLNALEIMARAYEQVPGLEAAWSNHRWFDSNGVTNQNISAAMPNDADPYKHPWVSSHLKTWKKSVSKRVFDANYRGPDGEYIKRAGDQAIYLPVLKLAKRRVHVPVAMYAYRCEMKPETFSSEDAKFQKDEAEYLRARGFLDMSDDEINRQTELQLKKLHGTLWKQEEEELNALTSKLKSLLAPPEPLPKNVLEAMKQIEYLGEP
jgi:glycosyltransferase involved in cell wall biosynthesis